MSTEAVQWAMDEAPMLQTDKGKPDTSARYVLWALAEHAHPDGTNAHPSVLRLQYRTGLDDRTVQRALRRLEKSGLIVAAGTVQGRTKWRLAMKLKRPEFDWAELEAEQEARKKAVADRVRRHRAKAVTHSDDVTETHSDAVTDGAVTHSDDVSNALEGRYVTHSDDVRNALRAAVTTNQPSDNQLPKDSSAAPQEDDASPAAPSSKASPAQAQDGQQKDGHLKAFGAFWTVYPKKREREAAKKAWIAAIERGAEPKHIVDAATAYAHERKDQDPKYTKYPATWLNKGCYDDEPDPQPGRHLRAVGDSGPHRNPEDDSDYHQDW